MCPGTRTPLVTAAFQVNKAENKLALAAGVGGLDYFFHVRAAQQADQNVELFFGVRLCDGLPFGGNDGQILERPFGIVGVVAVGRGQLHQMAEAP